MEERESPRPELTEHCLLPTFASPKGYKSSLVDSCKSSSVLLVSPLVAFMFFAVFLLSTDYVNNQNIIITHCDTL